ncbi:MAG: type III-A CRISPR-associated RAMP protein Csm3 [Thermodesulfobacteriota bacterium]
MKLIERYLLAGQIEVLTGLHIGAGKDAIEIGGIDSPVVKNPHTGEPYIPGSSLKGKLRCLMEWATNRIETDGKTWDGGGVTDPETLAQDPVLRVFGTTNKAWAAGPTRLLVRDGVLNEEWRKDIIERGLPLTEEKFENNIDRIKGKAGVGIRKTERVPAGAVFDFQMVYRVFDTGDAGVVDREYVSQLLAAMRLLETDALGGSGSRGYGRIKFRNLKRDGIDIQEDFERIEPAQTLKLSEAA